VKKRALLFFAAIGLIVICVYVVGLLIVAAGYREREQRFRQDYELVAPILTDSAFRRLLPYDLPQTGLCLNGPVPTRAEYERLRVEMARYFDQERVGYVMMEVWVEAATELAPAPRHIDWQR
jgi:hypothetical protein